MVICRMETSPERQTTESKKKRNSLVYISISLFHLNCGWASLYALATRVPRWDFVHKYMAVFDAVDTAIVAVYRTLILMSSHSSRTIGTAVDKVAAADFEQLLWHCICEKNDRIEHTKMFSNQKNWTLSIWLGTWGWVHYLRVNDFENEWRKKTEPMLLTLVKIHFAMLIRRPVCQPIGPMHCSDADNPNRLCSNYCIESNLVCCRSLAWAMHSSSSAPNRPPMVSDSNGRQNWHLTKHVDESRATIGTHYCYRKREGRKTKIEIHQME